MKALEQLYLILCGATATLLFCGLYPDALGVTITDRTIYFVVWGITAGLAVTVNLISHFQRTPEASIEGDSNA